uniref:WAT1-related protein n=1 Tax=Arundo donax TaxID=35708 RepID=A0A0A9DI95_ARUDO
MGVVVAWPCPWGNGVMVDWGKEADSHAGELNVSEAAVLEEYPNKMFVTAAQYVFSVVQSFIVAVVALREFSRWKLRVDLSLLAIFYSGFVVIGAAYYLQAWCVEMKGPLSASSSR